MVSPSYFILLRMLQKINYKKAIIDIQRTVECSRKFIKRNRNSGCRKTCRICIKEGTIPIYGVDADLSEPIRLFGGIELSAHDQYAKHICLHCHRLLKCAMLFRKLAMQSDEIKLKSEKNYNSADSLDAYDENVAVEFSNDGQGSLPLIQQFPSLKVADNYHHNKGTKNNKKYQTNQILSNKLKIKVQSVKKNRTKISTNIEHVTNNNQNEQITPNSIDQFFSNVKSDCEQTPNETSDVFMMKRKIVRVKCKICQKIMRKGYRKEHYALHDPTVPKHVCHICGKSFRLTCSLINHKYTHSTEFNFQCKICPYRGRSSMLLKMHMRSHTKDYKFVCTKCPARFTHKSNLNRHALYQHTEPSFKCDTCLKEFYTKGSLQHHITSTHMGLRNYLCDLCNGTFACRKGLMRHQQRVHKKAKKAQRGRDPDYMMADKEQLKQVLLEKRAVAEEE